MNEEILIKMKKVCPKKLEFEIVGFSQSKNGEYSFSTCKFSALGKIRINKITKFILDSSNGFNTIEDIARKMKDRYSIPKNVDIYADIDSAIHQMWRIGVIDIPEDNYLLDRYEAQCDSYTLRCLQYDAAEEATQMFRDHLECTSPYINYNLATTPDTLKVSWINAIEGTFEIRDASDEVVVCMTVQPDIRIQGLRILAIMVKDKNISAAVLNQLFQFIYKIYCDVFQMSTQKLPKEGFILQYYSFEDTPCHEIFKKDGELKKEINNKNVYIYSCKMKDFA
mgnify:FL=1